MSTCLSINRGITAELQNNKSSQPDARTKFTLLKADQSPDLSYSKRSLKTVAVLERRFQHVSLYWHQGHQEMKERKNKRGDEGGVEGNIDSVSCS